MGLLTGALPDFPWDTLTPFKERAARVPRRHRRPVGRAPPSTRRPRSSARRSPRRRTRPAIRRPHGTPELRQAVVDWFARRRGVRGLDPAGVLPTVGSKELVALLPSLLGLGAGDVVLHPSAAYPTYDVGARLAGATPEPTDDPAARLADGGGVRLVWLNSPGNPTGEVLGVDELARGRRRRARGRGAGRSARRRRLRRVLRRAGLGRAVGLAGRAERARPAGDRRRPDRAARGVLAVQAVQPRGLPRGVRRGGPGARRRAARGAQARRDDRARARCRRRRPPHWPTTRTWPSSASGTARRRTILRAAFEQAGYAVDASHAGLYLWVRPEAGDQDSWATVGDLASLGILVAPGAFYGAPRHVRVALTATDERIAEAAARLPAPDAVRRKVL